MKEDEMRILILTNYYPPSPSCWGYQQLCEEVTGGLHGRGHRVAVLTSNEPPEELCGYPYPVKRELVIDPDWSCHRSAAVQFFVGRRQRERSSLLCLRRAVADLKPDVIFCWHYLGLPRGLLLAAEHLPSTKSVYYLADYLPEIADEYLQYWQTPAVTRPAKLIKAPLAFVAKAILHWERKPYQLEYRYAACVSEYLRRRLVSKGCIPESSVVIHNGVNLRDFAAPQGQSNSRAILRCLIAGRIEPIKGIHTAIKAFGSLDARTRQAFRLTVLGSGPRPYQERLCALVDHYGLSDQVTFASPVPREQMPNVLRQHDVLLLPSEYEEPLARAMQEAMATRLLVIGTTTGGSGELLVHDETGLAFRKGDPGSLAAQLLRAHGNERLRIDLATAGKQAVERDFSIDSTISGIENYLLSVVDEVPPKSCTAWS